MKALVIGGNRFFGKQLVRLLVEGGHDVTILNRGRHADEFGSSVTKIKCDRKISLELSAAVAGENWDIVYDQICYDEQTAQEACDIFNDKTERYIFTSSVSVYKTGSKIKESAFNPLQHSYSKSVTTEQDYAEAKRQAECAFFKNMNMKVAAVRFPIVLGADDYTKRLNFHVDRIKNNQAIYFQNISAKESFVSSQDAALFLEHLSTVNFSGPINCASSEPIGLLELVEMIELMTNKKAQYDSTETPENLSPFSIADDWWVDTNLMKQTGFEAQPLLSWLPALVESLI